MPDLSILIPTFQPRSILGEDRLVLEETLDRLALFPEGSEVEILIVYHGPSNRRASVLRRLTESTQASFRLIDSTGTSLAAARNAGLKAACAEVCLMLNDDTWASNGMIARHLEFHRRRPEREAALLGSVVLARGLEPTPFLRWLEGSELQFAYGGIQNNDPVPGIHFYTVHVSAKRSFLLDVGGFDEGFEFGHEDSELGLRLERAGLRLAYDPLAAAEHYHPLGLAAQIARMRAFGQAYRRLHLAHPEEPRPRRPGVRHRIKAAALTMAFAAHVRPRPIRHAAWRFLCHEAHREGFWGIDPGPSDCVRIGKALARLALRDRQVEPPRPSPTLPRPKRRLAVR